MKLLHHAPFENRQEKMKIALPPACSSDAIALFSPKVEELISDSPIMLQANNPYPTLLIMAMFSRFRLVTLTRDIAAINLKLEGMIIIIPIPGVTFVLR